MIGLGLRIGVFAASLLLLGAAWAQDYPTRPVRLIVPFPPGGALDGYVRVIQPALAQAFGQPVVIENPAGAGGMIGAGAVARAAPDGYTLLAGNIQTLAMNAAVYPNMPYDPQKDFTPIMQTVMVNYVLVVNPRVPATNLAEFIAHAKANPARLTYATSGSGSAQHLAMILFMAGSGTRLTHVPYKGVGALVGDLIGGTVDSTIADQGTMMPQVKAGKLRALGVAGARRAAEHPDLPTIAEAGGMPGFEAVAWQGIAGPAGLPAPVVRRLNEALRAVQAQPAIRERLVGMGFTLVGGSPEEFARHIRDEIAKWSRVAREYKVTAD